MDRDSDHRRMAGYYRELASTASDRQQRCHYLDLAACHLLQCEPPVPLAVQRNNYHQADAGQRH